MKKFTFLTLVAIFVMALVGCDTTTTNTNVANTNANLANANANANTILVTNANNNDNTGVIDWTRDVNRDEFDKDRGRYEREAEETGSTIGTGANDLWLWTKTRAALATADDLRDSTINVDVENGVVTLRGTVGTQAQKTSAVKVAKGVEDVKEVRDQLKVNPNDSMANMGGNTNGNTRANQNANR